MRPIAGAILIGGMGRRFGAPKHDGIIVDGETALARTSRVLTAALGSEPFVIGGGDLPDRRPGCGPLGGIETAMRLAPLTVIVACDMPGVTAALIRVLADAPDDYDVVVPVLDGRRQGLCARWSARALGVVSAAIDRGDLAVHRVLAALRVLDVPEDHLIARGIAPGTLSNVNTREDLAHFLSARASS